MTKQSQAELTLQWSVAACIVPSVVPVSLCDDSATWEVPQHLARKGTLWRVIWDFDPSHYSMKLNLDGSVLVRGLWINFYVTTNWAWPVGQCSPRVLYLIVVQGCLFFVLFCESYRVMNEVPLNPKALRIVVVEKEC